MKKVILGGTLVCCLFAAAASGQAINATLTGTVVDTTSAVLPGVTVTATNNATGVASVILTNEAGAYNLQGIDTRYLHGDRRTPGLSETDVHKRGAW